jgi:hypothetical protein
MSEWYLNCYQLLLRPGQAFPRLAVRTSWGFSALILAFATLLHSLNTAASHPHPLLSLPFWLVAHLSGAFLLWGGLSLVLNLCAELFGGQGRVLDTMSALGLATLPLVLLAPVKALPLLLGAVGQTLSVLLSMGIAFWVLVLMVLGLQAAQRFSLDKAIGTLVTGYLLTGGLGLLAALSGGLQAVLELQRLLG